MNAAKVKVCRVETLAGAKMAAATGVDFIGLHAIDQDSFESSEADRFREITCWLLDRAPACVPVLVTRSTNAAFIADTMSKMKVSVVQLHECVPAARFLPQLARECGTRGIPAPLIVKSIAVEGTDRAKAAAELDEWLPWAWAVLLDASTTGGTGQTINWEIASGLFSHVSHGRTFLAGGISGGNAAAALDSTKAWALDAQTSTAIPERRNPRLKSFAETLSLVASGHGVDCNGLMRCYRWRRSNPRLLFSPSELNDDEFGHCSEALARSGADGVQIDVADGTAGVQPWSVGALEWASRCSQRMPEFPLWVHCFSRDGQWIRRTVDEVQKANPHFVGLLVQPGLEIDEAHALCTELEASLQLPVILSVTVGEFERAGGRALSLRRQRWQLTAPDANSARRAERISHAVGLLVSTAARVQLDRAVDRPLLESLGTLPHCVTLGRGLVRSPESMARWIIEKLGAQA